MTLRKDEQSYEITHGGVGSHLLENRQMRARLKEKPPALRVALYKCATDHQSLQAGDKYCQTS